jgi:hypothetical protein
VSFRWCPYEDAGRAADWIATAFGFEETGRWADEDRRVTHVNMELDGGEVMLGRRTGDRPRRTRRPRGAAAQTDDRRLHAPRRDRGSRIDRDTDGLARPLPLRARANADAARRRASTTDRAQLNITHGRLGLGPAADDLTAWESAELLLVTLPTWFDLATDYPANVVHAGPLGVTRAPREASIANRRPLVLLSFSTTVMQGQVDLIQRVCEAIAGQELGAMFTPGPAVSPEAIRPQATSR